MNETAAKHYLKTSLRHEYASENGTELNEILPKMSPLNPNYLTKNSLFLKKFQSLLKNIRVLVEKFRSTIYIILQAFVVTLNKGFLYPNFIINNL